MVVWGVDFKEAAAERGGCCQGTAASLSQRQAVHSPLELPMCTAIQIFNHVLHLAKALWLFNKYIQLSPTKLHMVPQSFIHIQSLEEVSFLNQERYMLTSSSHSRTTLPAYSLLPRYVQPVFFKIGLVYCTVCTQSI